METQLIDMRRRRRVPAHKVVLTLSGEQLSWVRGKERAWACSEGAVLRRMIDAMQAAEAAEAAESAAAQPREGE